MVIVRTYLGRAILALGLSLMALPAWAEQIGESVAVLYASDGNAVYRVDPNTGIFLEKIADLPEYLQYGPMTFDEENQTLYIAGYAEEFGVQLVGIDVQLQTVYEQHVDSYPWLVASIASRRGQLYAFPADCPTFAQLDSLDPTTGEITNTGMEYDCPDSGFSTFFFDPHGNLWNYWEDDFGATLRQQTFPVQGRDTTLLFQVHGILPYAGSPQDSFPFYDSFSFEPYTGVLFATYVSYVYPPEWPGRNSLFHTSLCTVDLMTGKPDKVIATYPEGFTFTIGWGLRCEGCGHE